MGIIKWKSKLEIDKEDMALEESKLKKEKFKGEDKTKLTRKELDELLILVATEHGYL